MSRLTASEVCRVFLPTQVMAILHDMVAGDDHILHAGIAGGKSSVEQGVSTAGSDGCSSSKQISALRPG
jgi:hypothetical protein